MTEEDLEEITKKWSANLLVSAYPAEISDIDSPEAAQDTTGPSKTNKTKKTNKVEEFQDIDSLSMRIYSITPDQGGDGEDSE
jgi:hypothetical protein